MKTNFSGIDQLEIESAFPFLATTDKKKFPFLESLYLACTCFLESHIWSKVEKPKPNLIRKNKCESIRIRHKYRVDLILLYLRLWVLSELNSNLYGYLI